MDLSSLWLAVVALAAATINGATGYGFSSVVIPIAILWFPNKVLNPALVMVEVAVNLTLLVKERRFLRQTWKHARPVVLTLFPGVILGTLGLTYLAVNDVKLVVYATLLPLVAVQLLGYARPLQNERRAGSAIGPGIGFLYSLTTISGPPLALFFRNQGLSKNQFRATIAQVRVGESTLTLATYLAFSQFLGARLVTMPSIALLPFLFVPVVIGVPLGTLLLRRVTPEFFRRFVMAFDGVLVSYGFSRVLLAFKVFSTEWSYWFLGMLCVVIAGLAWLSLSRASGVGYGDEELPPSQPPPPGPERMPASGRPGRASSGFLSSGATREKAAPAAAVRRPGPAA